MIPGLPKTELLQESTEAVVYKILQNSLENTFAGVYFLLKKGFN